MARDRSQFAGAVVTLGLAAVWVGCLFAAAGTLAWVAGWVYVGLVAGGLLGEQALGARRNPDLARRRRSVGAGTPAWDKAWNAGFWPLMIATAAVGGVDAGGRPWAGMVPWPWCAGLVLLVAGNGLSAFAMTTNPFFEGTVRIQSECGHRVFEGGPYRVVRHPGYAGLAMMAVATPFLLGSAWALVPATATALWIAVRTVLEDRFLHRNLAGYREYARRVRFRWVPGVW